MLAGDRVKTMSYTLEYWWPSQGTNFDASYGGKVGAWIAQNQKVLDKKRAIEVAKLIKEQFPDLAQIDAKHVQLQWARI